MKVQVKLEDFERMQQGHGDWADSMSEVNILRTVGPYPFNFGSYSAHF